MLNAPRESADCYTRVPETLPKEVLDRMHAPPKPDYPIIDAATLATFLMSPEQELRPCDKHHAKKAGH